MVRLQQRTFGDSSEVLVVGVLVGGISDQLKDLGVQTLSASGWQIQHVLDLSSLVILLFPFLNIGFNKTKQHEVRVNSIRNS
jgi:hypothetical protein